MSRRIITPGFWMLLWTYTLLWLRHRLPFKSDSFVKQAIIDNQKINDFLVVVMVICEKYNSAPSVKNVNKITQSLKLKTLTLSPNKLKTLFMAKYAQDNGDVLDAMLCGHPDLLGEDFEDVYNDNLFNEFLYLPIKENKGQPSTL